MQDLVAAPARYQFVVASADAGTRLDQYLTAQELPFTRSQLKKHIDDGVVLVGGTPQKPSRKLRAGEQVLFAPPAPSASPLTPEAIALRVLFEDHDLIVIDKPAGLVVHPAAGHKSGTLVNALLHHCTDLAGIGGELRPGIVHRLDRDTTGVMVAAKNDATHHALAALFKAKDLTRLYRAIVAPPPRGESGTISTLYGRHPTDRKRHSSRVRTGKRAVTHWRVIERLGERAALIECRLETGRTHQIRVHMADSGHAVLGDTMYGKKPADATLRAVAETLGRQALHAAVLGFVHPGTGKRLELTTPPPADMQEALRVLRAGAKVPR